MCPKCETVKPVDDFYTDKQAVGGLTRWCKVCCNTRLKNWRKTARLHWNGYMREWKRKKRERTAGRPMPDACELCEQPRGATPLQWDHCHDTGAFRGWICGTCNRMLGLAHDSIPKLQKAIEYLCQSTADKKEPEANDNGRTCSLTRDFPPAGGSSSRADQKAQT